MMMMMMMMIKNDDEAINGRHCETDQSDHASLTPAAHAHVRARARCRIGLEVLLIT